jgi:hypothetical protein
VSGGIVAVAKKFRAPTLVTTEPIGPVTRAEGPIPVIAMYRWAPPFGDGSPHPRPAVAVAWTRRQVQVRRSWAETSGEAWLPARDVHRPHEVPNPAPVVARVRARDGELADIPGLLLARAGEPPAAVLVLLAPGTDDAGERWLPIEDLVEVDPLTEIVG